MPSSLPQYHNKQQQKQQNTNNQTVKYNFQNANKENSYSLCIADDVPDQNPTNSNQHVTHSCHVISTTQTHLNHVYNRQQKQQPFQLNKNYLDYRQTFTGSNCPYCTTTPNPRGIVQPPAYVSKTDSFFRIHKFSNSVSSNYSFHQTRTFTNRNHSYQHSQLVNDLKRNLKIDSSCESISNTDKIGSAVTLTASNMVSLTRANAIPYQTPPTYEESINENVC
jgi:hypothetical protein